MDENSKASTQPPYLVNNSWEQEINYKLWVTKGARFVSARRCEQCNRGSQLALTFLSGYLIIIGIAPFFIKTLSLTVDPDVIALGTTAISVLLLAYSLIESSKSYELRAHKYHNCALKVSKLYNALRRSKENEEGFRTAELERITETYEEILRQYENHSNLDFLLFKTQKPDYHGLSYIDVKKINLDYYFKVHLKYHLIIILPPVLIGSFIYFV